ncbi:hypothetical protein CYY_003262 [Polysphondylium violaceum]|uniref:Uncharacterized protein n=1 Tax=Polysphondylium violaceum TaxID=133409 RepID=A0A8J4V1F6_9MYCE|nr:hypothetical protein CYY_003262 [Polysphondylium violaceum]
MTSTVEKNYEGIIGKINTFIDTLFSKNTDTETFQRPTREQIIKSAKTLSHEITKICLLLQDLRAKPEFFDSIEETLDNIFSVYQGLAAYSSDSLFKSNQVHFRRLMKSVLDIFVAYKRNEESLGEDEENIIDKQLTARAWKSCEDIEKITIKNSIAIIERNKEISSMIQDASEEILEFQEKLEKIKASFGQVKQDKQEDFKDEQEKQEQEDKDDDVNGEFEQDDEEAVYDLDDDLEVIENISQQEVAMVDRVAATIEKSLSLSKVFGDIIKSNEKSKDKDDVSQDTKENVETMEKIINLLNELSKQVDDIASAVYPPQNLTYLESQTSDMDVEIFDIITLIKSLPFYNSISKDLQSNLNNLIKN